MSDGIAPTRLFLEQKAIQLSIYADIIPSILGVRGGLSITKLFILSFLSKQRHYSSDCSFDGRTRTGFLRKAACDAAGRFEQLLTEIQFFCDCLLLLSESGIIGVGSNGEVHLIGVYIPKVVELGSFEKQLIEECDSLDDSFVWLEVLRNV